MIKYEQLLINNVEFIKAYSDEGYFIYNVNDKNKTPYAEAKDIASLNYKYKELDIKIEEDEPNVGI